MRNWNLALNLHQLLVRLFVSILPMRNWNTVTNPKPHNRLNSVSILPMRNWNIVTTAIVTTLSVLVFYLWGIETSACMGFDAQNCTVSILPMRNWNLKNMLAVQSRIWVSILPMRNWNSCSSPTASPVPYVSILPMRNWKTLNISSRNLISILKICADLIFIHPLVSRSLRHGLLIE